MEIEIVTTKRKITKRILSQMRQATVDAMQHGIVLGYVINGLKDSYKTYIIKHEDEYFITYGNWRKGEKIVSRRVGRGTSTRKFEENVLLENWWSAYERVITENHMQIFI